jgi:hypothetical protein
MDASFGKDCLESSFHAILAGHITLVRLGVSARGSDLFDDSVCGSFIQVENSNTGATGSKLLRNGAPDTARATRNDRHLAIQAKTIAVIAQK